MFRIHLQPVDISKVLETLEKCYKEYHIEHENNQKFEYTLHYYYHMVPTETSITIDPTEKEIEITVKNLNGADSAYYIGFTIRNYLIKHHIPVILSNKRSREGSFDSVENGENGENNGNGDENKKKKVPPPSPAIRPIKEGKKIDSSVGIDEMMNDIFVNVVRDAKTCSYEKKQHIYETIASFSESEQGRLFLLKHIPFLLESITLPSLFEDCKITKTINRCASTALANVLEFLPDKNTISGEMIKEIDETVKKTGSTSIKMRRECARILGHIILLQISNL